MRYQPPDRRIAAVFRQIEILIDGIVQTDFPFRDGALQQRGGEEISLRTFSTSPELTVITEVAL